MTTESKTTYHLEMLHPTDLRPKRVERSGLHAVRPDGLIEVVSESVPGGCTHDLFSSFGR